MRMAKIFCRYVRWCSETECKEIAVRWACVLVLWIVMTTTQANVVYVQEIALGMACRLSLLVIMTCCGVCNVWRCRWANKCRRLDHRSESRGGISELAEKRSSNWHFGTYKITIFWKVVTVW